ncbi:asparagine synthase (glutamine-hydrolyzing), partial [Pelagibacteraceae bacterium]|nr:asparagine synthase (glutamine-hydrolyzing) [Pelagibacteraceae bacterium]
MCGIFGVLIRKEDEGNFEVKNKINNLLNLIEHRGPDNKSYICDKGVLLGHTRLSIIDLTSGGNQPMKSNSGRFIITFNGEIYNFESLKRKIDYKFKTNSDTEVLLALIENYGVYEAIKKIEGMFAFGLLDKKLNKLYLVRDRAGEKPLYFSDFDKHSKFNFLFGSEIKLFNNLLNKNEIDQQQVNFFLNYGYISGDKSIFKNINKLKPGHIAEISISDYSIKIFKYWEYQKIEGNNFFNSDPISSLEKLIENSVKKQMVSDVPLGSFLSGGIDSSLVTYFLQKNSSQKVNTFNIGFENKLYDESSFATEVSKHFNTRHTKLNCSHENVIKFLNNMHNIYDEPFGDPSQIPTYLVSSLAKSQVKVSLSGDGADELFGGYD